MGSSVVMLLDQRLAARLASAGSKVNLSLVSKLTSLKDCAVKVGQSIGSF